MALRESQQQLGEKARRAAEGGPAQSLLGFESGAENWLVDLADAGEVLPVPNLSEVPLTKAWFRGIANVRGTLYGVTDLAAFHGGEPTELKPQCRLLLAGGRPAGNIALLMSATQGLRALSTLEAIGAADNGDTEPWRGLRYRDSEGRTWTHLRLPLLLATDRFLNIAT